MKKVETSKKIAQLQTAISQMQQHRNVTNNDKN